MQSHYVLVKNQASKEHVHNYSYKPIVKVQSDVFVTGSDG